MDKSELNIHAQRGAALLLLHEARTTGEGDALRGENETVMSAGAQAHRMLTEAHMPQSGIDRFCVLANDIVSLANDEFEGDAIDAACELTSRIGGLANLKSYTDCLLVGNRKFGL